MNREYFKKIIRMALKEHPLPEENLRILEESGHDFARFPCKGHCAEATLIGYILFGRSEGLKAYKDLRKGGESHYWLANPAKGHELDYCDLTEDNSNFDYTSRRMMNWINAYEGPEKLKHGKSPKAKRRWKLYQLVLEKMKGYPPPSVS